MSEETVRVGSNNQEISQKIVVDFLSDLFVCGPHKRGVDLHGLQII
jgi:hypothetical protein